VVCDCCAIGLSGRFNAASAGWDLAIGSAKITVRVMVAAANHRVRVNRVDLILLREPIVPTGQRGLSLRSVLQKRTPRQGMTRSGGHSIIWRKKLRAIHCLKTIRSRRQKPQVFTAGQPRLSFILMAKWGIRAGNDGNADGIKRDVCLVGLFAVKNGLFCQEWKNHMGSDDHGQVRVVRSAES
jgi:hypothetical protein